MKFLIALTLCVLGCNGQYSSPIGTKTFSAPVVQSFSAPAPLPVVQAPVQYAAPIQYAAPVLQQRVQSYGPVEAAVQTRRTIEFRQVDLPQDLATPQVIEVNPNYESVQIHFKTASSPLSVRQSHIPAAVGPVEHTSYQDNAHRLVNEIVKPVIQEVREIIQPYRRITQEIRPVIEEVHTIVHKGERLRAAYIEQQPLPLKMAAPAYGSGALLAANAGYKAAKAA
jgi:hypothetical protein